MFVSLYFYILTLPNTTPLQRTRRVRIVRELTLLHMQSLDISLPFDAAVWATACCTFWGVCHLSENTSPSLNDSDPSHQARRATSQITWTRTSSVSLDSAPDGAHWFIPWTKTTGFVSATIIISKWDHVSCPIHVLQNHILVNSSPPDDMTFFAYRHPTSPSGWSPSHDQERVHALLHSDLVCCQNPAMFRSQLLHQWSD